MRQALANKLDLTLQNVTIWFQNRRQRDRKKGTLPAPRPSDGGDGTDDVAAGGVATSAADAAAETTGTGRTDATADATVRPPEATTSPTTQTS